MGVLGNNIRLGASAAGDYEIEKSLRFNPADSAYLNRTPSGASNRKTFTYSCWFKQNQDGIQRGAFLKAGANANNYFKINIANDNKLYVLETSSSSYLEYWRSNDLWIDPTGWMHLVAKIDSTQGTGSNRIKMYINGTEISGVSGATPAQNYDFFVNNNVQHEIGSDTGNSQYGGYYIAECHLIDGLALSPTSFAETHEDTGQWVPKKYIGSYGTNGFFLNYKDNSGTTATTLGKDSSGNGNNFTPNNFSVTPVTNPNNDCTADTPSNNHPTWNYMGSKNSSLSNGALVFKDGAGALYQAHATMATPDINVYKYYFEATCATGYGIGIAPLELSGANSNTGRTGTYVYYNSGNKYDAGTSSSYGTGWSSNAVIGVAIGEGKIRYWLNGVAQGDAFTGLTGPYKPYTWAAGSTGDGVQMNFGARPFSYTPPTGYVSLCAQNLPDATVINEISTSGSEYFMPLTYTGNGGENGRTGVGFSPNLVWVKSRSHAHNNSWFDTVRGANAEITSNSNSAEATGDVQLVKSFDADGFTLGTNAGVNGNGKTFVAWCWKESATAGFDIVGYTGNGSVRTISHSLNAVPEMIIYKIRSTTDSWIVYHKGIGATKFLVLNAQNGEQTGTNYFNNQAPTSSVFTVGTDSSVNANGGTHIAYLFSSVEGYSKCGEYTGNGSANGPFVYTGFKPMFLMVKATNGNNWAVFDSSREPYNKMNERLHPNLDIATNSGAGDTIAFCSNGFRVTTTDSLENPSGSKVVYLAIAERPFKYSNAR